MTGKLLKTFKEIYKDSENVRLFFAPGRVNLIGEHTDYNGGHVFPCALSIGTFCAVRLREDSIVSLYSINIAKAGVISADIGKEITPSSENCWANYPLGVIKTFIDRGYPVNKGFDMVVYGNIPAGSGLSSSASLEVMTGYVLVKLFNLSADNVEIARIGQYSENNFNGMNCGIMDQFASSMGKKDNAIFLDTATLKYEYVPIKLEGMKIVVTNSKVKHSLVTSAYNDRRNSCETALKELKKELDINGLGDLSEEEYEAHKALINDTDRQLKAKHAVYENVRTLKAVEALKSGDIGEFGRLMNMSHISLRDDYDVSCREIDVLVEEAWKIQGCLGSRITGGGFGGCTVSIVKDEAVAEFEEKVGKAYTERTGNKAEFYVVEIGDGPRELEA